MSTMVEVWGFRSVLSVEASVQEFCRALGKAAKERGIPSHLPSDALDASRDLMLDEAAQAVNATWSIADECLRLAKVGLTINWDSIKSPSA